MLIVSKKTDLCIRLTVCCVVWELHYLNTRAEKSNQKKNYLILQIKLAEKKSSVPVSKEFCLEQPVNIYIVFSKPADVIIKITACHVLYCQYSYVNVSSVQMLRSLFLLSVSNRAGLKSVFYNAYS